MRTGLIFLFVWLACAGYEGALLKRGWVPHDDGAFALSAERVLQGEMPHRDFDELYTGGLTYLNAAAFRLWGTNFSALRWMLFLFFLAWIPAIFYIADRFVHPLAAAGVTLLAVVASVPVYSAAVPSWYNLFFATFGSAAIVRYLAVRSSKWLFIAGLCGGLSLLAKISGLYFFAAILLLLIFLEQSDSRTESEKNKLQPYSVFLAAGLAVFLAGLGRTIDTVNLAYVIQFIVPGLAISAYLLRREFNFSHQPSGARFRQFFGMASPLVLGFVIPLVLFAIPYLRAGAMHSLITGVFVAPTRRFSFAALHPTHLRAMNLVATAFLIFVLARATSRHIRVWEKALVAGVCLALLIASGVVHAAYSLVWSSMVLLVPALTLIAMLVLATRDTDRSEPSLDSARLFTLISVLALTSLIQFPFAAPIYFCYVTPLVLLSLIALIRLRPQTSTFALATLLIFYIAFWVFRATPGFIYNLGLRYAPNQQTASLDLPRGGGLLVEPAQAAEYSELISAIQQHAHGDYIYAAPDCPAVYFLAGKRNPTRTTFDFFADSDGQDQRILAALERTQVHVVVISSAPAFSHPMDPALVGTLSSRFPMAESIGHFLVRWRE